MSKRSDAGRQAQRSRKATGAVSTGLEWPLPKNAPRAAPDERLELEHFVPYQAVVLSGYFSHELSKAYRRHGLSVSDWRVLGFVAANAGCTSAELTSRVHLDEVAVHRAVTSLLARGLVRRDQDRADKRRKPLNVTREGREVYRKVIPLALAFEDWMLGHLSDGQRRAVQVAFAVLGKRLGLFGSREPR